MRHYAFIVLIAGALFVPVASGAQAIKPITDPCDPSKIMSVGEGQYVPLACYQNTPLQGVYSDSTNSFSKYVSNVFAIAISVGAILAVIRLVWAGYHYMGSDLWTSKEKAKNIITGVVWGILLLLGTYLILYQINPCMLNLEVLSLSKTQCNNYI